MDAEEYHSNKWQLSKIKNPKPVANWQRFWIFPKWRRRRDSQRCQLLIKTSHFPLFSVQKCNQTHQKTSFIIFSYPHAYPPVYPAKQAKEISIIFHFPIDFMENIGYNSSRLTLSPE